MKNEKVEEAARALLAQHREKREFARVDPAPATIEDGYRVQDSFLEQCGGELAGWKIALTTPVMQKFVGLDHPVAGPILAGRAQQTPASVNASDFIRLGVETEIAIQLATDARGVEAPYDRHSIAEHVAACMAGIEIVDDRSFDYENPDGPMFAADGAFNRGCVVGPAVDTWRDIDLAKATGRMVINGTEIGTGVGEDVLGHPLEALAWLANHLLERGRFLRAGDIVLTGSIVPTQFLKPGDEMTSEVQGLGAATVRVS